MGLFDLDELPALARGSMVFGYNRPGLFSFHDKDHGDSSGQALRPQVEGVLAAAGLNPPGGAIRLLCMPRLLGYVFNPLSVYFCYDKDGMLRATVHEVNNTFGERHFYAHNAMIADDGRVYQTCAKEFRVSPFLPMDLRYDFTILPPAALAAVHIAVSDATGTVVSAWFDGQRKDFGTAALLGQWLIHPLMTFKVIVGIHWEALLIWVKHWHSKKPGRVS